MSTPITLKPVDDTTISWEDVTSENGASFSVGRINTDSLVNSASKARAMNSLPIAMTVDWPCTPQNKSFIDTTSTVQDKIGITKYSNSTYDGFLFSYKLRFIINKKYYTYKFFDKSGDSYKVYTFSTGEYFVRFNSPQPDIIFVTAE